MTLVRNKNCLEATERKPGELKVDRKAAQKASRQTYTQTKADREREVMLVGEAGLRRVDRGDRDETDFRQMMDEELSRVTDRSLFVLG